MAKKKTRRKKVKDELDKLSARYIKIRDGGICQWCGRNTNIHVSHIIPKSRGDRYRWDPENLKCLCYHCHLSVWHKDPIAAMGWFKQKFPERHKYLERQRQRGPKKYTIMELEELRDWYIRAIENEGN